MADIATDRDRWRLKAMSKPQRAPAKARIPKDCWRRLVQLAHHTTSARTAALSSGAIRADQASDLRGNS